MGTEKIELIKFSPEDARFLKMYGSTSFSHGNKYYHLPIVYKVEQENKDGSIFVKQKKLEEADKILNDMMFGKYD